MQIQVGQKKLWKIPKVHKQVSQFCDIGIFSQNKDRKKLRREGNVSFSNFLDTPHQTNRLDQYFQSSSILQCFDLCPSNENSLSLSKSFIRQNQKKREQTYSKYTYQELQWELREVKSKLKHDVMDRMDLICSIIIDLTNRNYKMNSQTLENLKEKLTKIACQQRKQKERKLKKQNELFKGKIKILENQLETFAEKNNKLQKKVDAITKKISQMEKKSKGSLQSRRFRRKSQKKQTDLESSTTQTMNKNQIPALKSMEPKRFMRTSRDKMSDRIMKKHTSYRMFPKYISQRQCNTITSR